jgi:hypothetical protein
MDNNYLSTCCGAKPWFDESDICSCCKEHADFEYWQEGADPEMKHWEILATHNERFSGD